MNASPSRFSLAWELARPFTLIAPALGMFTGSVIALGAPPAVPLTLQVAAKIALGTLMAAVLNAASNTLNQNSWWPRFWIGTLPRLASLRSR